MIQFLAPLFCCLAVVSSTKRRRFIDGEAVDAKDMDQLFSFVAYVALCDGKRFCKICTGALVHSERVLIAAHCYCKDGKEYDIKTIDVYFKSNVVGKGRRVSARTGARVPFKCTDTGNYQANHDFALLLLDKAVKDITPVPMECDNKNLPKPGTKVMMLGYQLGEKNSTRALQIGLAKTKECGSIISDAICIKDNEPFDEEASEGDSGGPILMNGPKGFKLYGIHSGLFTVTYAYCDYGETVRHKDSFDAWAKVQPHCSWIFVKE